MTARKRLMAASLGLAGLVVPLTVAGSAQAEEASSTEGFPSTQSPGQPLSAVGATVGQLGINTLNALEDRPDGANGNNYDIPDLDPRFVEGPVGGLLNDPFS